MIWELVKRDPAWKMMPYCAVTSAVVWGIGAASYSEELSGMSAMMAIGLMTAYRSLNQRYAPLHLTLPIEGKQLYLARVLALLGFIWIPLLTAFAAMAVSGGKLTPVGGSTVLALGGIITLAMMLMQSVRVENIDPPGSLWGFVLIMAGVTPLMAGLLLPGSSLAVIASVIGGCLLASGALFLKGWAEVPKCLQLAPVKLQPADRVSRVNLQRTDQVSEREKGETPPWRTLARAVYFPNWRSAAWPIVMIMSFVSLLFGQAFSLFAAMYITISYFEYRKNVRWLLHLPISPRRLAWLLWLPASAIVILWVTFYAGMNTLGFNGLGQEPAVHAHAGESGTPDIRVPAGYWRLAPGGIAPPIEAPWGERSQPDTTGPKVYQIYNPFTVGPDNSERFLDWQFERATDAVYGVAIPRSQAGVLSRMKTTRQKPRAEIIVAALPLLYVLLQICTLHFSNWKRVGYLAPGLRMLIGVAPMLAAYLLIVAPIPPGGGSYTLEAAEMWLSSGLPENLWVLGLMAVAAIAGLYWLADRLWIENEFGQIEMLTRLQATGR